MSSTLFGGATPVILNADDGNTYVLGTDFVPNVAGTITHARRYFPTTPQSGVSMGLYRVSDQALLGSINFPDGTSAGWQQQAFSTPIAVTAGVQYQITYFTPSKYTATSAYGFPFTSGDLTASAAPNGVFNASVPALQFASGNLGGTAVFADVVFEPAGSGTTTVTSDLAVRWRIRAAVTSDLAVRWGIRAAAISDLAVRWRIRGAVTSDLAVRWGVGGQVVSDLRVRWRVLADAVVTPIKQGSWYQLLNTYREQAEIVREERMEPPVACPNDGEPLLTGPRGELYCPYDGWRAR